MVAVDAFLSTLSQHVRVGLVLGIETRIKMITVIPKKYSSAA